MVYPFKIPSFIQQRFPDYLWRMSNPKKVIYLTFDDGPTPDITEWVLNLLKEYKAKASFFCIGKNLLQHPDLGKRIVNAGHTIGNHSFSHPKGWKTNTKEYINDIVKTEEILQKNKLMSGKWFRPPYGKIKRSQAKILKEKGYKIVFWEVLSGDFDSNLPPKKSLYKTLKHTKSGSIVVFHDSLKAKKNLQYTLPKALEYWAKKGYRFQSL